MAVIRELRAEDIPALSALIQNTLLVCNLPDYELEVIENLITAFSPFNLRTVARRRRIYVYVEGRTVQGAIGSEGDKLYNFFVAPDRQGRGVGTALLEYAEARARESGLRRLTVDSSLTAAPFYRKKGYTEKARREDERYGPTITMEKRL